MVPELLETQITICSNRQQKLRFFVSKTRGPSGLSFGSNYIYNIYKQNARNSKRSQIHPTRILENYLDRIAEPSGR